MAASFSMEKKCKNQSNENEDTEISILMEETELEKTNTKTSIPIDNGERKRFTQEVCDSSVEAERVDLYERIETVMDDYYALYPNNIYWHLYAGGDDLKQFRPYNASPSAIKYRSDEAARLYEEIAALRSTIDTEKLMPRELKSLIQLLHFLRSNFGQPFGDNYYNGKVNWYSNHLPSLKSYRERVKCLNPRSVSSKCFDDEVLNILKSVPLELGNGS